MSGANDLSRRELIGLAGASLLVGAEGNVRARVEIADNGAVTVFAGKVEEGQGARTELMMAAAEELGVAPDRINVVLGDTMRVPDDGVTAGSRTTPATVPQVRRAAASLRDSSKLTPRQRKPVFGRPHGRHNGWDIVTGRHQFPSDVASEDALYGAVLRPPSYEATLESVDVNSAAEGRARVIRDGDFAGCVAPTSYEARQALAALGKTAVWKEKTGQPSNATLFEHLKSHARPEAAGGRGRPIVVGDVDAALASATRRCTRTYTAAYIQHAPMETRAACAEWQGERVTVWTGTSNPFAAREAIARACNVPVDNVRVIVPDFGGGFGGKHSAEAGIEAARLARAAGKSVSLRWTRNEEFTWGYCRPAALIESDAALGQRGEIEAWRFVNYNSGGSAIATPYRVSNAEIRYIASESPLRQGSYRALAATANNFARECMMDELTAISSADPLEFRLAHLTNDRIRAVLLASAKKFAWQSRSKEMREGRGIGIACGTEKDSVVAACVEVAIEPKARVPRVVEVCQAFECGAIINPANLQAQVEGAIVMAMGGMLREEIRFADGKLSNARFSQYRVPRFRDVPKLDVVLVNREADSVGAGETPMIALAPAVAGAVFAATGRRIQSLPFSATNLT
ncbi:MAG TPA: molybdopterin cofactor-binding domain-containing protein [Bryobacteraceae bacterium]|nr:molybdopterin cofactor-binding domain-containing protein [Bryobacteraceae bacterium]